MTIVEIGYSNRLARNNQYKELVEYLGVEQFSNDEIIDMYTTQIFGKPPSGAS